LYAQLNATATFELRYVVAMLWNFCARFCGKAWTYTKIAFDLSYRTTTARKNRLPRPMCCDSCHIITLCVRAS